jgi:GH25 family lysozyme M1 (1,4-beta-N-acetylmuramidase)
MKNIWDILTGFLKNHVKKVIFLCFASLLVLFAIIYLVSAMQGKSKNSNTDDTMTKENTDGTVPSDKVPSQAPSEDPTGTPDLISGDENLQETEPQEMNAEVQSDAKDPQKQGTTGVKMNIKDLAVPKDKEKKITYGIDVAKWQGVIDWKKVKEAGVQFAMIRVGYRTLDNGAIVEDPYAKYNLQQASKNGIMIGAYFFSTALSEKEAKEEAAWVAEFIAPYPITYPVAYNCEGFMNPENRQYGISKKERTDAAIAFLDYVKEQGYTPMFYAAKNEMEQNAQWDTDTISQRYKVWVAQYPERFDTESKSSYSGPHAMWQYTSKGIASGVEKPVDLNVAYFGYKKIAKPKDNTPQKEVSADPTDIIQFKKVKETVTAKIKTNLRSVPSAADADTVAAVLKNGDTAVRTGIAENGWSRLKYKGETLYAVSSYLTTDLDYKAPEPTPAETGPIYKKVKEEVTAKEKANLRSEPGTDREDTIKEVLLYGDVAVRTGIGDNGWSKVEYKGQVLYALSKYLTTNLKYQEKAKPSKDNPESGIHFIEVNEKVTAKEVTNLRLVPSTEAEDTVAAVLHNGDIAVRTGIGDNGWSRVEYDGKVLYAVTNYLKEAE